MTFHFLLHAFITFLTGCDVFCPLEILPGTPGETEKIDVERLLLSLCLICLLFNRQISKLIVFDFYLDIYEDIKI